MTPEACWEVVRPTLADTTCLGEHAQALVLPAVNYTKPRTHACWMNFRSVAFGRDGKLAEWWPARPTWGPSNKYPCTHVPSYLSDKVPAIWKLLPADLGPKKKTAQTILAINSSFSCLPSFASLHHTQSYNLPACQNVDKARERQTVRSPSLSSQV